MKPNFPLSSPSKSLKIDNAPSVSITSAFYNIDVSCLAALIVVTIEKLKRETCPIMSPLCATYMKVMENNYSHTYTGIRAVTIKVFRCCRGSFFLLLHEDMAAQNLFSVARFPSHSPASKSFPFSPETETLNNRKYIVSHVKFFGS